MMDRLDPKDLKMVKDTIMKLPYDQTIQQFLSSSVQYYVKYLKTKRVL